MTASGSEKLDELGIVKSEHNVSYLNFTDLNVRHVLASASHVVKSISKHSFKFSLHVTLESKSDGYTLFFLVARVVNIVKEPVVSLISDLILKSIITRSDGLDVPIKLVHLAASLEEVKNNQEKRGYEDTNGGDHAQVSVFEFNGFSWLDASILNIK